VRMKSEKRQCQNPSKSQNFGLILGYKPEMKEWSDKLIL